MRTDEKDVPDGLEKMLNLKSKSRLKFLHGIVFPGQLSSTNYSRCHVFKMTTKGPAGSGVDLVNKMRPFGEMGNCWVCFDQSRE